MKRWVISLAILTTVAMPMTALAVTTPADAQATAVTKLQGVARAEIARRITTLNNLATIVSDSPHLSNPDKAALQAQIQAEITALQGMRTKIENDSDLTSLKTDIVAIHTEFRVFSLLLPKVHLLRVVDRLSDAVAKETAYADKLQTHIDTMKAAGKDVTALEATMKDIRTQIATAQAALTSAKNQILNVTPEQFNSNKIIVNTARDTLNSGRMAVVAALKDGNQILAGLNKLKS